MLALPTRDAAPRGVQPRGYRRAGGNPSQTCSGRPAAAGCHSRALLTAWRQQLYALKPEFCSVTYGAGGSTQEGTFAAVREIPFTFLRGFVMGAADVVPGVSCHHLSFC